MIESLKKQLNTETEKNQISHNEEIALMKESVRHAHEQSDFRMKGMLDKAASLQVAEDRLSDLETELHTLQATEKGLRDAMDSLEKPIAPSDFNEGGEGEEKGKGEIKIKTEKEIALYKSLQISIVKNKGLEAELLAVKEAFSSSKAQFEGARTQHEESILDVTKQLTAVQSRLGEVTERLGASESSGAALESTVDEMKEIAKATDAANKSNVLDLETSLKDKTAELVIFQQKALSLSEIEVTMTLLQAENSELKRQIELIVTTNAVSTATAAAAEIHLQAQVSELQEEIRARDRLEDNMEAEMKKTMNAAKVGSALEHQHKQMLEKELQLGTEISQLQAEISARKDEVADILTTTQHQLIEKDQLLHKIKGDLAQALNRINDLGEEIYLSKKMKEKEKDKDNANGNGNGNEKGKGGKEKDEGVVSNGYGTTGTSRNSSTSAEVKEKSLEVEMEREREIQRLDIALNTANEGTEASRAHVHKLQDQVQALQHELEIAVRYASDHDHTDRGKASASASSSGNHNHNKNNKNKKIIRYIHEERAIGKFIIRAPSTKHAHAHTHVNPAASKAKNNKVGGKGGHSVSVCVFVDLIDL